MDEPVDGLPSSSAAAARRSGRPRRNARYTVLDADGPLPLDMVRAVPAIRRDPLTFLQRVVECYGDLVAFPMPRTPVLLVNDPDGVRRVLVDNQRAYDKHTVQYLALSTVTGTGLLTADGEQWRHRRRIAQPAFHHSGLPAVAEQAVTAGQALRRRWEAAPGHILDADAACMTAMLEVVGRTLFDADLADVGESVVSAVDAALRVVVARAQSPVPAWVPTLSRRRLRRCVSTLDAVCLDVVRRRRSAGVREADADLLALLLRAADAEGGLSDQQVRDEIVTLVIAGHETVASALAWTLDLLAGAPEAQERLGAEVDDVLAGGAPSWEALDRLVWTRAVVDEALRLYPPAWVLTRRALEPDVVAGVAVPAGTLVVISPWLLHRRAASWPDPLAFDPSRFLDPSRLPRLVPLPRVHPLRRGSAPVHRSRRRRGGDRARAGHPAAGSAGAASGRRAGALAGGPGDLAPPWWDAARARRSVTARRPRAGVTGRPQRRTARIEGCSRRRR